MATANRRRWAWQYALPVLVLAATLALTILIGRWLFGAEDPDFVWVFAVGPLVAFLTGLLARPAHAWVVPAAVVLLSWTVGLFVREDTDVGALFALTLFLGLPWTFLIWSGRELGRLLGPRWTGLRRRGPHAPAT